MKGFLLSLRSEFYKSRKTLGFWCAIILPLLITGLVTFGYYTKAANLAHMPAMVRQVQYASIIMGVMGSLLLPMYIIFVAYSVNSIEHKADTWKTLFSLPISKLAVYASKYFYALFLVALCLALFLGFTVGGGYLLGAIKPEINFGDHKFDHTLVQIYIKLFLASLGILSIQFLLSLLWSDFLKPIGIGFVCTITGVILASNQWEYAYLFPYSHPIMTLSLAPKKKNVGAEVLVEYFTKEINVGIAIAVVVFILGFFIVQKRSVK